MAEGDPWRLLRSPPGGPAWNMALDEALLRADPLVPTLRTYTWDPHTLSLGRFQAADVRRIEEIVAPGRGLVRRSTGGRAIFHGHELTFSVVCPRGDPRLPGTAVGAYEAIHGALVSALRRVGTEAVFREDRRLLSDGTDPRDDFFCFYASTPFDLVSGGRKLVGSAQRRTGRGFLVHGSIPVGHNPVTPRAAGVDAPIEDLRIAVEAEVAGTLGVRFVAGDPTPGEKRLALRLAETKFGCREWTFRR